MRRMVRWVVGTVALVAFAGLAFAEETKIEKMQTDQTQAKYQRKSITFLGLFPGGGVMAAEDGLAVIQKAIREKIELPRFDYNAVELGSAYTIDQFIAELRAFVKARATDRAAAESEYEARFKRAKVLATDVDRIMGSAYFYVIDLVAYSAARGTCPDGKLEALALGCLPGTPGVIASVNATASFFRANLMDESKPPYEKIQTVQWQVVKSFKTLDLTNIKAEDLAAIEHQAMLEATASAASTLADFLSKEMKKIPDFQLLTPVTAALSDGVEFMLGKKEGVGLDDTYDVTEFDAAGQKSLLGYVKVRTIGEAEATGGGTPTYAEKVKEKRKFVGGELMIEHPMVGLAIGVAGMVEACFNNLLAPLTGEENKMKIYPGFAFYVDKDLANLLQWPEFYVSIEGDFLLLDQVMETSVYLVHGMLGAKKKWYMESLVFSLGVRAGISYYQVENYEDNAIGVGGDLLAGIEYYFSPEFSIFFKAGGRFFTNPLSYPGYEFEPEMGAHGQLGAFLAF